MTDNDMHTPGAAPDGDSSEETRRRAPKRVIGTPSPAESRRLLAESAPGEASKAVAGVRAVNEEKARRAERVVALCFALSFLASVGFIAAYVIFQVHSPDKALRSNLGLGATLSVAMFAIAVGATVWVRHIMPHYEVVQEREPLASTAEEKQEFAEYFMQATEDTGITRRPLLRRSLLAALVPLGLAPIVLLRDLGPLPRKRLRYTAWKKGTRLIVDGTGQPIRPSDFDSPGSMITVVPEGYEHDLNALAKATAIIIKLRPEQLKLPPDRMNWTVNGIVAYSKICTHVGCPAALYEQQTHRILCPCHQSTFDATRGAKVVFGPAARPLPQLPITVDSEGYLVAQSDFHEPVGPSFWERGGKN